MKRVTPSIAESRGQETRPHRRSTFHLGDRLSPFKGSKDYRDLGGDFFDRLEPERLKRYYVKRLQHLGLKVTVEPCALEPVR